MWRSRRCCRPWLTAYWLDERSGELARAVEALPGDIQDRTWLVETFYPTPEVADKIGFATKNALMTQGLSVSDRKPVLSAGDVDVLLRMSPDDAFIAACRRYADSGAIDGDDVLLAVAIRDLRETALHAGFCADGTWTWLQ